MAETEGEKESKAQRAAGVGRMLNDEAPPEEPAVNDPGGSTPVGGAESVGESIGRSGEDIAGDDGKEAGRIDTGVDSETGRPTGTSVPRDGTGVDP